MFKVSLIVAQVFAPFTAELEEITTAESLQFDFRTIRAATDNFSLNNKLGEGGFGGVYKVLMLACPD